MSRLKQDHAKAAKAARTSAAEASALSARLQGLEAQSAEREQELLRVRACCLLRMPPCCLKVPRHRCTRRAEVRKELAAEEKAPQQAVVEEVAAVRAAITGVAAQAIAGMLTSRSRIAGAADGHPPGTARFERKLALFFHFFAIFYFF